MYSTRRFNKNLVDGNAYITNNDPYQKKDLLPERWQGKRLACPARPPSEYFSPFTYASEPYGATDPDAAESRSMGFGSKSGRAGLSDTMRTEQYRETLLKEVKLADRSQAHRNKATAPNSTQEERLAKPPTFVYDIGRFRTTTFNPRLRRDRYHAPRAEAKEAAAAPPLYRVTSADIGEGIWTTKHAPPQFGPISCLRGFYDKSHLKVAGDA